MIPSPEESRISTELPFVRKCLPHVHSRLAALVLSQGRSASLHRLLLRRTTPCPKIVSQENTAGCGTVREAPVFGLGASSGERFLLASQHSLNSKLRFQFLMGSCTTLLAVQVLFWFLGDRLWWFQYPVPVRFRAI